MAWWRWVFGWVCCAFVVASGAFARPARADDTFAAISVCVRPPIIAPTVAAWVFTGKGDTYIVRLPRKDWKKQAGDLTTYVFDPYAPPDSVKRFPKQYTNLVCPPPPPKPVVVPPPPPAAPKKEEPAKGGDSSVGTWGAIITPEPKNKKDKADEPPPGTPPPLEEVPPEEWHPKLPKGGVAENWPHSVLPIRKAAPPPPPLLPSVKSGHGVLPIAGMDGKGLLLPMANRPQPQSPPADPAPSDAVGAAGSGGEGTKKGDAVEKTTYEKWCEQIGLAGGLANLQLTEDIHRADGSKYGIPGGKNPNGIKSATAQAAAGAVMVAAVVITAGGFDKKLYDALKKGAPILIRGGGKAAEQVAEKLVQDALATHGKHGAEDLAAALASNGAIGEYSVMAKFTQGLGAKWQAHHILEVKFANRFMSVSTDRLPAVILSDVQHKAFTAKLAAKTRTVENAQELWAVYKEVYEKHPLWLAAIESYFRK